MGSTAALGEKPHLNNAEAHKGLTVAAACQQSRQHLWTMDEKWEVHWKNELLIETDGGVNWNQMRLTMI